MSEKQDPPRTTGGRADSHDDPESTFALLERVRDGDVRALERLFARHLRPLQRWTTRRLPNWARDLADTDDLVQDALLQTFKRIEHFEHRRSGALQAYLRQAVVNRLRDELRRRNRLPVTHDIEGLELANDSSPLDEAIGREAAELYEQALRRLRPEDQEAIVGRVEMGYSYDELAQVLGKPSPDAARKAAQRAILKLAEELKGGF